MARGYVLWEGKSLLDNKPIVVIGTGFVRSKNRKTGAMVQIWILRSDMSPLEAANYGQDKSVCGNCKHRPATKFNPNGWGTCYVHLPQGPQQIYKTFKANLYSRIEHADWQHIFQGRRVRFGAYGDPAAVPFDFWSRIHGICDYHTGYTHQWQTCDQQLKSLVMASVDTPNEYQRAQAMGWRTFRVRMENEPLESTERVCPASEEAGKKATCETCMACHGGGNQKANIAIIAHGGTWKPQRFVQIRILQQNHKPYRPMLKEYVKNRVRKDLYYKDGMMIRVIRDKRGNAIRLKKTPCKSKHKGKRSVSLVVI